MIFHACLAVMRRFLDEISCFLAAEFSFRWCDVRTVDRWVLKDAGDDGLLDVAWFCVCKLGGSLAGEMNVSWVVVVGASAIAFGDRVEVV
jgi:hypothetical protein